jgi:hypothetical protein
MLLAGIETDRLRIAVLHRGDGAASPADWLRGDASFEVLEADSMAALVALTEQPLDAVVADPELAEGWPSTVAEMLDRELADTLPVIVVCAVEGDAALIRRRAGRLAHVLLRAQLSPEALAGVVRGSVAAHRATLATAGS